MPKSDNSPVFLPVFAAEWDGLPEVFRKHYANRAYSRDTVLLRGEMQFEASRLARWLSPLLRLGGMPPLFTESGVAATVQIASLPDRAAVTFSREFLRKGRKPLYFRTEMHPLGQGEVIDWTRGDSGWNAAFSIEGETINMAHRGYCGRLFGKRFHLPLEWLIGTCNAHETAEGDNRFSMRMEMRRRNGKLFYAYGGMFEVAGVMRRNA